MSFVASFIPSGRELDPKQGSYYSNMTGFWHGDVQLHNLTALNATEQASPWRHLSEQFMIPTNLTAIPELQGPWNWTRSNKVTLNVGDKLISVNETKSIAIIHVSVRVHKPRGEGQSPGESFHRTQTWGDDVAIRFLSRVAYCPGGDPEAGCLEAAQFQTDVSPSLWLSCTGGMMLLHGTECNERLHQSFHSVHTYTS